MKRIALIGCGRISTRHIEAIEAHPELEIAVVCDIDKSKAKKTADRTGARCTGNLRDINGVDIASILTPSGLHPQHIDDIARYSNVPLIVTEKPISLSVKEAMESWEVVKQTGKRLLAIYQNRYNPLILAVRDLLNSGKLGRVYQFICNVLWNRSDEYFAIDWHGSKSLDGGVLYTQASHYVDMLLFLFGEWDSCKGVGGDLRQLEVFDSFSAVIKFKNGTIGSLNASVNAYEKNYATEFTLIAEKGIIHMSGTNLNIIDHWNVEGMEKPDLDFLLDHEYGKGHNTLYEHIANEKWDDFPSRSEVLSGIRMMEELSCRDSM